MSAVDIAVSLIGLVIGFGALGYAISLPKSPKRDEGIDSSQVPG